MARLYSRTASVAVCDVSRETATRLLTSRAGDSRTAVKKRRPSAPTRDAGVSARSGVHTQLSWLRKPVLLLRSPCLVVGC